MNPLCTFIFISIGRLPIRTKPEIDREFVNKNLTIDFYRSRLQCARYNVTDMHFMCTKLSKVNEVDGEFWKTLSREDVVEFDIFVR